MAAAYSNLYIEKGADFTDEITLADFYGVPYDLTLFSIYAQARKSYITDEIAITFECSSDASNGIIQLHANNSVTANLNPRNILVYDVFIQDKISGYKTRVAEGQVYISPSSTKNTP